VEERESVMSCRKGEVRGCAVPHEKLLGILRVSNLANWKDLADRTWGGSGTNQK